MIPVKIKQFCVKALVLTVIIQMPHTLGDKNNHRIDILELSGHSYTIGS